MNVPTGGGEAAVRTGGLPAGPLIGLLTGAAFVVILNETIMGVALPDLMAEFVVPATTAQWLTTAFLLTMAIVIPVSGWLLNRLPLRTVFVVAMGSFTVGTGVCALAPVFGVLVAGRVVQAVGTALMMPLLITTVLTVVEPQRRGRMMGIVSIVISVAPAVGPTISGIVLDQLTWRWMFWLVLPISVLALMVGAVRVRSVESARCAPLDVLSVVLSALAFGGLIYGLTSLGETGKGDGAALAPMASLLTGAAALAWFVRRQLALGGNALLDLRAFATRTFSLAVLLVAVSMMALFGMLILLPIYLQTARGMSTLVTGLLLLPGGLVMGLLAPPVGLLFDRFGPRPLVAPGAIAASIALWGMAMFGPHTDRWTIVAAHVLLSVGLAFMFTPLLTSALGALPTELYSHGSAIVGTVQQVAGAAGTALFVTVMTRTTATSMASGASDALGVGAGVHAALLWGGVISAAAAALALFVRRPTT